MGRMARAGCCLAVAAGMLFSGSAAGGLAFAPLFNDGAVLQCEMAVAVWGKADPGAAVAVSFAGQEKSAVAGAAGKWMVRLDPMPPSSEPRTLVATSPVRNQRAEVGNVVVGEVWLATGQSNMVMPLRNALGGEERLKATLPGIRFTKVPQRVGLPVEGDYTAGDLAWNEFRPGSNAQIAATAFFFAEALQPAVGRMVGIVQSSVGGTPAQAWTPLRTLEGNPELRHYADAVRDALAAGKSKAEWLEEIAAANQWRQAIRQWNKTRQGPRPETPPEPNRGNPWNTKSPTVLYENMIAPLVPYTARGVIWYQGEGNAGNPAEYRVLFPAMIGAWREDWNRPDWPFLFVQLAAYGHPSSDWPGLRAAQAFTRDTVANTGMALAIDVGEEKDIHPRAKQPVGERLARLALGQVYGRPVASRGPCLDRMSVDGGKVAVVFRHVEEGLRSEGPVAAFEVAGADGAFHPAQAWIVSKDTVELACGAVGRPVAVRYAWHNWIEPPVTLQNSAGLPAEPFLAEVAEP